MVYHTLESLKDMARTLGVKGFSTMNKEELLHALNIKETKRDSKATTPSKKKGKFTITPKKTHGGRTTSLSENHTRSSKVTPRKGVVKVNVPTGKKKKTTYSQYRTGVIDKGVSDTHTRKRKREDTPPPTYRDPDVDVKFLLKKPTKVARKQRQPTVPVAMIGTDFVAPKKCLSLIESATGDMGSVGPVLVKTNRGSVYSHLKSSGVPSKFVLKIYPLNVYIPSKMCPADISEPDTYTGCRKMTKETFFNEAQKEQHLGSLTVGPEVRVIWTCDQLDAPWLKPFVVGNITAGFILAVKMTTTLRDYKISYKALYETNKKKLRGMLKKKLLIMKNNRYKYSGLEDDMVMFDFGSSKLHITDIRIVDFAGATLVPLGTPIPNFVEGILDELFP